MNAGWWTVLIAGLTAVVGWAWFIARMAWTVRGALDRINDSQTKLDQHLAWHWEKGQGHALWDESRQRARKPRVQADREPGHGSD